MLINNKNGKIAYGEAFSIDGKGRIPLSSINTNFLNEQLQNIKIAIEIGDLIYQIDVNKKGTFEELVDALKQNNILIDPTEPVLDFETSENLEESIVAQKEIIDNLNGDLELKANDILELRANDEKQKDDILDMLSLLQFIDLESETIDAEHLIIYAKFNNIDIGKKTTKDNILKAIYESIK